MHMADALISPAVGGAMWAAAAGTVAYAAKKVQIGLDERKVPLMGVLGAFVFAAQMINFTIPGTGSSGHIGGGILLAILLGPHAAFLTLASILTVQALFFADGGLLALGCNIFNMGIFPCYVAYPFIFKPLTGEKPSQGRLMLASVLAAVSGLQMGAFGVVVETMFSGISELPFATFALLMQPIHLGIGIGEGLITAAVIGFIFRESPDIIRKAAEGRPFGSTAPKRVLAGLFLVAFLTAGVLSWFASSNPDGLEWSIFQATGEEELAAPDGVHSVLAQLQEKFAVLPDYNFPKTAETAAPAEESPSWPAVDGGTSAAGVIGTALTLILAFGIGKGLQLMAKH